MKKRLLIPIFIVGAVSAAVYVYLSLHRKPSMHEAKRYEISGNLEKAYSLYAAALYESTPSMDMLDNYRSKFLTSENLKKEIEKYFLWLSTPSSSKTFSPVTSAIEGTERCKNNRRSDISITIPEIRPLSVEEYLKEWNKTFFAPEAKIDPSHEAMASGNHTRNVSLIVIRSEKTYKYEINLINPKNCRGTRCVLLPENEVRLYAHPGEHLLVCRSIVTFSSEKKIWRSDFTVIPLTVPEKSSLLVFNLKTRVFRKKK